MMLIADSGGSKTEWMLGDRRYETQGLHPIQVKENGVVEVLSSLGFKGFIGDVGHVSAVRFYGAGCATPALCEIISAPLLNFFPHASVFVESDLIGAARAACGNQTGIVAILGTGSASFQFDGEKAHKQIPSLGYALGDEGSGANLGKLLLKAFFYHDMPSDLAAEFTRKYPEIDKSLVLGKVYQQPLPARFLGSFSHFYIEHLDSHFIHGLLVSNFDSFIKTHLLKYDTSLPVHSVGSIAFHFKEIWEERLVFHQLKLGMVLKSPIDGLVKYHGAG